MQADDEVPPLVVGPKRAGSSYTLVGVGLPGRIVALIARHPGRRAGVVGGGVAELQRRSASIRRTRPSAAVVVAHFIHRIVVLIPQGDPFARARKTTGKLAGNRNARVLRRERHRIGSHHEMRAAIDCRPGREGKTHPVAEVPAIQVHGARSPVVNLDPFLVVLLERYRGRAAVRRQLKGEHHVAAGAGSLVYLHRNPVRPDHRRRGRNRNRTNEHRLTPSVGGDRGQDRIADRPGHPVALHLHAVDVKHGPIVDEMADREAGQVVELLLGELEFPLEVVGHDLRAVRIRLRERGAQGDRNPIRFIGQGARAGAPVAAHRMG